MGIRNELKWTSYESLSGCISRHCHNKSEKKWDCKTGAVQVKSRGFLRSVRWENTTYSLQHARMVTSTIVSLLSYLFFCLSSGAIVSCNQQRFNDRNLVLLNSAAWTDTDAKTFLELVVFPSWLLYFTLLLFSLFSLLFPPHLSLVLLKVTVNVRETEEENASGMDRFILKFCSLLSFFLSCLCVRVLNAQRKAVYSAVQSGLRNTMYIPVLFSPAE